jgi:hypothetical protein
MTKDVKIVLARCLYCASVHGSVERPYGQKIPVQQLWHFLAIMEGYLLVIKDDASKYMLLPETMSADDHSVVRALLHWFSIFGVTYCWVPDQRSHFKYTVIVDLQRRSIISRQRAVHGLMVL